MPASEIMSKPTLAFEHRSSYQPPASGRDRYIVGLLSAWLNEHLAAACSELPRGAMVLDVGCGEQPFRQLIESFSLVYRSSDVVQNNAGLVDVVAAIDGPLPDPWPDMTSSYSLILCTEVLEHVSDWSTAFTNLHRLLEPGGLLIVTTPFVFPLHMEPYDYFRATPHSLRGLAESHGFQVEKCDRLGHPFDVLATLLADTSILPARRSLYCRCKARATRTLKGWTLKLLESGWARRCLSINSHTYLSNAAVLRKI